MILESVAPTNLSMLNLHGWIFCTTTRVAMAGFRPLAGRAQAATGTCAAAMVILVCLSYQQKRWRARSIRRFLLAIYSMRRRVCLEAGIERHLGLKLARHLYQVAGLNVGLGDNTRGAEVGDLGLVCGKSLEFLGVLRVGGFDAIDNARVESSLPALYLGAGRERRECLALFGLAGHLICKRPTIVAQAAVNRAADHDGEEGKGSYPPHL